MIWINKAIKKKKSQKVNFQGQMENYTKSLEN